MRKQGTRFLQEKMFPNHGPTVRKPLRLRSFSVILQLALLARPDYVLVLLIRVRIVLKRLVRTRARTFLALRVQSVLLIRLICT